MLLHLLMLAGNAPPTAQPTLSSLVLTPNAGSCSGSTLVAAASIRLNWQVAGPNDAAYQTQISINGGTPVVLSSTSVVTYLFPIPGVSAAGTRLATTRTDSFEVRMVRTSDSVVVQTLTGSYTDTYGQCGGAL